MINASTIGYMIDHGEQMSVHCEESTCRPKKFAYVDLDALAKKLGREHAALHWDLLPHFVCDRCQKAGRPKRIGFIRHANTMPQGTNPFLRNSNSR